MWYNKDRKQQVKFFDFWDERDFFYLSKMFSEQLKSYDKLKKCIHVSILDFILFPEDNRYYRTIHFRDDETNSLYSDKLELQILELKKLPKNINTEEDILNWMLFFNGKNREDFENMATANTYLGEAYETLQKLSADDMKRLEYEAREKALKDYNTQMSSSEKRGIRLARSVFHLHMQGKNVEEIASECNLSIAEVREILAE